MENTENRFFFFLISSLLKRVTLPHYFYRPLSDTLNIQSLSNRRNINDLQLLFKLLNGFETCPELLGIFFLMFPNLKLGLKIHTL